MSDLGKVSYEPKIVILEDAQAVHVRAAEEIAHFAGEDICTHAEFNICLSGGSTPTASYELLATRFKLSVDWREVRFFWGDERCVPPENPLSNFGVANQALLSKLGLRPDQLHRIKGELPPAEGATQYEEDLRESFGIDEGEFPRFGLILLGLGDNAHTASLFPGDGALKEEHRLAVAVEVDAEPKNRITLTAPLINNADRVMFLVSGKGKAEAVRNIFGPRDPDRFPAQLIAPTQGQLIWLLDKAAASLLPPA
jgi:6-phosphogluconolactonase